MDDLDETGEDVQNDKASTKKLYLLLAGIIALIFVALLTIALFVFPGFLTDNSDSAPAQQQQTTPLSDRTDQSGKFRVGDTLRVVSGGSLLNVHITEFTADGAMTEDEAGNQFVVSQNQLDRYANEHPEQFADRLPDVDEGKVTPQLDPTSTPQP